MSGIDEQIEDLICSECGKNCVTMYLHDEAGFKLCWVDTRLYEVRGDTGFRTQLTDFDAWDSVSYIKCSACGLKFPIKEEYGFALATVMKKGIWFGCDVR